MLRRLLLRDVAIVDRLEVEFDAGFTVLTGETGAGKSILIDALQLALGSRGDATFVREGSERAEVGAEFDAPAALADWLDAGGFASAEESGGALLLRRSLDRQGRSRAWINGRAATVAQLREAGEMLVDIHGQHAWQSLTRAASARALLDAQAGTDTAALAARWQALQAAEGALGDARASADGFERERERLAWQIAEVDKLAPRDGEWDALNAEHQRLAHAQSLLDGVGTALALLADADPAADALTARAIDALEQVARYDAQLDAVLGELRSAQAQLQDAARSLHAYLSRAEPDPARLATLDARLSAWLSLARRHRRAPGELPALLAAWREELRAVEATADLDTLQRAHDEAQRVFAAEAAHTSRARAAAAPKLAAAVTQAMQTLGMAGGRFEVALQALPAPQSFGAETVEFLVAGHAGSSPRPLAKVASGGELSRLALAVAVSTLGTHTTVPTLIFDEIDAGVGGSVAYRVGQLMQQLGTGAQVLAVTHLAQVAACADHHFVVSKEIRAGTVTSDVQPVGGEARVTELARMLGGERLGQTSRAHAQAMLGGALDAALAAADDDKPRPARGRR